MNDKVLSSKLDTDAHVSIEVENFFADSTFEEIGVSERIIDILSKQNIFNPTHVQKLAIPRILQNDNVLVGARTGSGKTLAFVIPVIMKIFDFQFLNNNTSESNKLAYNETSNTDIRNNNSIYQSIGLQFENIEKTNDQKSENKYQSFTSVKNNSMKSYTDDKFDTLNSSENKANIGNNVEYNIENNVENREDTKPISSDYKEQQTIKIIDINDHMNHDIINQETDSLYNELPKKRAQFCTYITALIISPTRELCQQIYTVSSDMVPDKKSLYCAVGGIRIENDIEALIKGAVFIIASVGRLNEIIKHNLCGSKFSFKELKVLVLDEADRMLAQQQLPKLIAINDLLPNRQTALFSATIDSLPIKTYQCLITDPVQITIKQNISLKLQHGIVKLGNRSRSAILWSLCCKFRKKKILCFFSSCASVTFMHTLFGALGSPVWCIHGKLKQQKREYEINSFRKSLGGVLFCTDVAARGIDISDIQIVINAQWPSSFVEYVHRAGRTARATNSGTVLTLYRSSEKTLLNEVEAVIGSLGEVSIKCTGTEQDLQHIVESSSELRTLAKSAINSSIVASACSGFLECSCSIKELSFDFGISTIKSVQCLAKLTLDQWPIDAKELFSSIYDERLKEQNEHREKKSIHQNNTKVSELSH